MLSSQPHHAVRHVHTYLLPDAKYVATLAQNIATFAEMAAQPQQIWVSIFWWLV